ncbi:MAG: lipoyl(octanoyl) transferase [Gallionellaceae bacterium]|nr:MAG: lipoyl(octanoyl) transferase [Gallionellaceae bacterium]
MSGEEIGEEGEGKNIGSGAVGGEPECSHPSPFPLPLSPRFLGLVEYQPTWRAMKDFTAARATGTQDEIWMVQHPPVYTLGQAGKPEHLLCPGEIPVVRTDRGGQITYHGPGQVVAYLLLDLRRRKINVRQLVRLMEQAVINLLAQHGVAAQSREGAPGVYVGEEKIAALGLKIRNGCCYHGLALNVDMDLTPFARIHPCGYAGLRVTQVSDVGISVSLAALERRLAQNLLALLLHAGFQPGISR